MIFRLGGSGFAGPPGAGGVRAEGVTCDRRRSNKKKNYSHLDEKRCWGKRVRKGLNLDYSWSGTDATDEVHCSGECKTETHVLM